MTKWEEARYIEESAVDLAALLQWRAKDAATEYQSWRYLYGEHAGTPLTISIRLDTAREGQHRWIVSAVFNEYWDEIRYRSFQWPQITVSADRGLDTLAREIRRRLLPRQRELVEEFAEARAEEIERESECQRAYDALVELSRSKPPPHLVEERKLSPTMDGGAGYLVMQVTGPNAVRIERASIPLDLARHILEVIRSD